MGNIKKSIGGFKFQSDVLILKHIWDGDPNSASR